MTTSSVTLDCVHWYERWERQQESFIARREERFNAMLDALEWSVGQDCVVIDLACGPGAIARRVTDRFPRARVIAVDLDPLLIHLGRGAHTAAGERIRWVEASLLDPGWLDALPLGALGVERVDAVLSTTAIHWLQPGEIVTLYRSLAGLLRPGGIFANGDRMRFEPARAALDRLSEQSREAQRASAEAAGVESWWDWWRALREDPAALELLAERDRRFTWRVAGRERAIGSSVESGEDNAPTEHVEMGYALHRAALLEAGFAEVGTIWQEFDNRVLLAVR